jgi:hypothetical protein
MGKGLLERMTELENQLSGIVETIQGICRAVGTEEVQAKVAEVKREKMAAPIAAAVKKGDLKEADKVSPESLVVGVQWKKDGNVIFPGRFQLFVKDMIDEVRAKVIGAVVDSKISLTDGGKIGIAQIYDPASKLDKAIAEAQKVLNPKTKKPRKKK